MRYAVKKTLQFFLTLFLVSLIVFLLFSVIPGDPARIMLGLNATDSQVQALRAELGLDVSLPIRYFHWLTNLIQGNPGMSVRYGEPVAALIGERLPVTLTLGGFALLITIFLSIPIGMVCAKKPGGIVDRILSVLIHILMSLPAFVTGLLLTLFFGFILSVFVIGGFIPFSESPIGFFQSLFLPSFAVALPKIAMTANFVRDSILSEKDKEYVRTAKSHGLTDQKVMRRHIFPNALLPTLTALSITAGEILGGSIVVEQIFNLPGLSRLLLQAVSGRDFPLVQGIVLYLAAVVILLHFAMDILYSRIDPRVRLE